jgi:hypothetical protein
VCEERYGGVKSRDKLSGDNQYRSKTRSALGYIPMTAGSSIRLSLVCIFTRNELLLTVAGQRSATFEREVWRLSSGQTRIVMQFTRQMNLFAVAT